MRPLKKGDLIGIVADSEYNGAIVFLTPYHISVQIKSQIGSIISREIPERYRDKVCFAVKLEDEYMATENGVNMALDLLIQIGREEEILLNDPFLLKEILEQFRQRRNMLGITPKTIRNKDNHAIFSELEDFFMDIIEKHFPEIRHIEFTEDVIEKLEQYVENNA